MSEQARRVILSVTIAGHDVASAFAPYLLDFSYKDNIGGKSDEVQISLHNRDGRFSGEWTLKKSLPVEAGIICKDWETPGSDLSLPCGEFKIDEIEFSGPPDKISIKAVSADLTGPLRDTRKTRAWENTSLSGVAGQIAGENGLALFYLGPDHPFERQDQRNESDISFLNRIALDRGCHCKAHNGKLAIFDAEQAEGAGASLVIPKKGDMYSPTSWSFRLASSQTAYGKAEAAYTDPKTGTTHKAEVKSAKKDAGSKNLTIQTRAESAGQAITLGRARLHAENIKEETVNIEIMGCPKIAAGQTVELADFGTFSGTYSVKSATHKVGGNGGYTTSLELTAPAPTSGVSAHDTVLGEGKAGAIASGSDIASPGAPASIAAIDKMNSPANELAGRNFVKFLEQIPEILKLKEEETGQEQELSPEDETILVLPEIAHAEAERATDPADRQAWLYLEKMFYRWLGNSEEPFWIAPEWLMSVPRGKETYDDLKAEFLNERAQEALSGILLREGKLTDKIEYFDFTNTPPDTWQKYQHQFRSQNEYGFPPQIDPLTIALGRFTLYGFARGWIEPIRENDRIIKYRVHITGGTASLHDSFDFMGAQSLGTWNKDELIFEGLDSSQGIPLINDSFNSFRKKYGIGTDFQVLTPQFEIENLGRLEYDIYK